MALFARGEDFVIGYAGNGDLVMAWPVLDEAPSLSQQFRVPEPIYTRRYSPLGIPRGPAVEVVRRLSPLRGVPLSVSMSITGTPNGGHALAWTDGGDGPSAFARFFGVDGEPASAVFPIAPGDAYPSVSIVADDDGNLIATYGSVLVRRFEGPQ